jgi:SAM-dependent methyltransferase
MSRFAADQPTWESDPPTRDGRLTLGLDKAVDRIIEIGPGFAPLAPKAQGWRVWTVDHASREDLVAKYAEDPSVNTAAIEEVDFVWQGGAIEDRIPGALHGSFDVCLTSHAIEHIPDFVGFFRSLAAVLDDDGTISMAIPDKRYCFDYFRPHSTTGAVLAAHYGWAERHGPEDLFDHFAHAVSNDGLIAWGQSPPGPLQFINAQSGLDTFDLEQFRRPQELYEDCHGWQFTPSSFSLLILELSALGLVDFRVRQIYDAAGCEFLVHLERGPGPYDTVGDLNDARLELLKGIVLELGEQADLLRASMSADPAGEASPDAVGPDAVGPDVIDSREDGARPGWKATVRGWLGRS